MTRRSERAPPRTAHSARAVQDWTEFCGEPVPVATGQRANYSDTWQLAINTGTTVATFLMIFVLPHSQNRDSTAIQQSWMNWSAQVRHPTNSSVAEKLTENVEEMRWWFERLKTPWHNLEARVRCSLRPLAGWNRISLRKTSRRSR